MHNLRHGRLRELLSYDSETGIFTWLRNLKGGVRAGDAAGYVNVGGKGYILISVDGRMYTAHRLAWFYMTGVWPECLIDHRDQDKTNNRWANLREASREQNMANSGLMKSNTSGVKGVSFARREQKWHAYIGTGGKRKTLGYFESFDDAKAARLEAEREYHGDFRPDGSRRCFFAPPPNS